MRDDIDTAARTSASRPGWIPVAAALLPAALIQTLLTCVVGAACLVVDGKFGAGHLPVYVVAVVLGGLSLRASAHVFASALRWERSDEAGR